MALSGHFCSIARHKFPVRTKFRGRRALLHRCARACRRASKISEQIGFRRRRTSSRVVLHKHSSHSIDTGLGQAILKNSHARQSTPCRTPARPGAPSQFFFFAKSEPDRKLANWRSEIKWHTKPIYPHALNIYCNHCVQFLPRGWRNSCHYARMQRPHSGNFRHSSPIQRVAIHHYRYQNTAFPLHQTLPAYAPLRRRSAANHHPLSHQQHR